MKQVSLLIAFCALLCLPAFAQSTTTAEKNTSRITITTTKVDESGKTITETWIAEGNDPTKILDEMAVDHKGIQTVEIENATNGEQEKIFQYRAASDKVAAEQSLNALEPLTVEGQPLQAEKVIIVTKNDDQPKATGMSTWHTNGDAQRAYATVTVGEKPQTNCAALGVLITRDANTYGAIISALIEKGGAQEARLKIGDIIKKVDEFDVSDYPTLFFALSHFRPGDQAVVVYDRDGDTFQKKILLKGWDQIPGQEFRARTDCGNPEPPAKDDVKPLRDETQGLSNIQPLELEDARVYPNPTDGVFSFSFTTAPGPLAVTITDINGKVVYRDLNDNATGSYSRDINIKDFPQGNYIIGVMQGDKRFTQQISKQ